MIRKKDITKTCFTALLLIFFFTSSVTAADTYIIDAGHSSILFKVKHLAISWVSGRFNHPEGIIEIDEKHPSKSSITVHVKAKNIDTNNPERDKHLRNPDFFDVAKYPYIKFTSTSVKQLDKEKYEVSGSLLMHGVAMPLTVIVKRTGYGKDPWGGYRMGFETSFKVKRNDFKMKHMTGVGNDVHLTINIEGIRE